MVQESKPIRVAINGGGMAGSILIHALLNHPNLDVHIFESAASFKEPGIAIGILRNAKTALDMIGPSATQCLERAGSVYETAFRWVLGRGPDTNKLICKTTAPDGGILNNIVQRAAFIRELFVDVPPGRMHASKKLVNYDQPSSGDGPIVLHFVDGTTHECDVLIGADGIRSRVRQLMLGEKDPASHPVAAGWWLVQTLQDYNKAQAALGKDLVDINNHDEIAYLGDGILWLHNVLSSGDQVQCALVVKCDHDGSSGEWRKEVKSQELQDLFSPFPAAVRNGIKELMCQQPTVQAFYMWEHLHAGTYAKGPVCITGDAAHSTTPWQASGAGMSIEDAMILSNLLGRAKTPAQAQVALQVYDRTRRPRTQRIVDSSRRTGHLFTGSCDDFDVHDMAKMRGELEHRWDFIMYIDMQKHLDDALAMMDKQLQNNGTA